MATNETCQEEKRLRAACLMALSHEDSVGRACRCGEATARELTAAHDKFTDARKRYWTHTRVSPLPGQSMMMKAAVIMLAALKVSAGDGRASLDFTGVWVLDSPGSACPKCRALTASVLKVEYTSAASRKDWSDIGLQPITIRTIVWEYVPGTLAVPWRQPRLDFMEDAFDHQAAIFG
jgi:hypothetical protein